MDNNWASTPVFWYEGILMGTIDFWRWRLLHHIHHPHKQHSMAPWHMNYDTNVIAVTSQSSQLPNVQKYSSCFASLCPTFLDRCFTFRSNISINVNKYTILLLSKVCLLLFTWKWRQPCKWFCRLCSDSGKSTEAVITTGLLTQDMMKSVYYGQHTPVCLTN